jgi:hypothetical protein
MQCGSRFSVFRCVKTRRLQTAYQTYQKLNFAVAPIASGLPRMRDLQVSQTQRDFARLRNRQRISFPARNQPTLHRLLILGNDWVRCARGIHKPENADVVGPSGMAMIAVVTDCCEITA